MTKILTAVVIAGCATVFFSALPADARIAHNGLAPMPVNERLSSNGLPVTGLDISRIGQKALGK